MRAYVRLCALAVAGVLTALACAPCVVGEGPLAQFLGEEQTLKIRDPAQLPRAPRPDIPPPVVVGAARPEALEWRLPLDEAIRVGLANSEVVRVLTGVSAANSGRTVYDAAITNTTIDEAKARFDPQLQINHNLLRSDPGQAVFDPAAPGGVGFGGVQTTTRDFDLSLSKRNVTGGNLGVRVDSDTSHFRPGLFPLDPETRSPIELSYVQPLLQGSGVAANTAPIVLARIDTERSFFQFKDSMQELLRGVIEAYWALVFARTDAWTRRQQVEQGAFAYELARARLETGFGEAADVAQTEVALYNFRAALISADANVLDREAALRNLLGLPPTGAERIVPTTPPFAGELGFDWNRTLELAAQYRPDVIELKLILEADEQRLLLADNQARPQLNATALYRWNGIEGETPAGQTVASGPGQFTDWTLGVNFSVPLGLRAERAALRRQELLLARDQAHLQQGLHNAGHELALTVRNLAQFYRQYEAYRRMRDAAQRNLEQQREEWRTGRQIFLTYLQAITDWGNAISLEAQTLAQYNVTLAVLERQTGTILEAHGIRFYEERFRSIGPLGRLGHGRAYPLRMPPTRNEVRYSDSGQPAENFFDLNVPSLTSSRRPERAPAAPPLIPRAEPLPPPRPRPDGF